MSDQVPAPLTLLVALPASTQGASLLLLVLMAYFSSEPQSIPVKQDFHFLIK